MATTTSMASSLFTHHNSIIPPLIGLLSVLFAAVDVAGEPPSVVPSACKRAYAAGGGAFTEDFCLSALTGHSPGAADNGDLALVAVDLATANATATEATIDAQLNGGGGGALAADGLRVCLSLYGYVVHVYQPDCHAAVKDRMFRDGKLCLGRTARAPVACEREFEQRNVLSPVAAEDDALAKLAKLAIALSSIA
ncbi:hypothetical protein PAHAL_2G071000 [Panicum hallii]|jgi:pectinesterase inhibitor-like protein|uniref:Pectinesterase inhibitor domain-containing protein n=1 Tax=Panicum hallii TaxID=206008 RepID=A0A2T8KND1_9POAL|nr:uncharacterized protein LOC112880784 [Panicum hallii]PVH63619.1 hypothetical protein PAHAL_2G071000 [Panicum hallii]